MIKLCIIGGTKVSKHLSREQDVETSILCNLYSPRPAEPPEVLIESDETTLYSSLASLSLLTGKNSLRETFNQKI